jgi:hypothetical protein
MSTTVNSHLLTPLGFRAIAKMKHAFNLPSERGGFSLGLFIGCDSLGRGACRAVIVDGLPITNELKKSVKHRGHSVTRWPEKPMEVPAHRTETSSRTAYWSFLGWRRKIGCITLLLACALMLAYLRGHFIGDAYYFGRGAGASFTCVHLTHSGLMWRRVRSNAAMIWRPGWVSYRVRNDAVVDPDDMNPEFTMITMRENFYAIGPAKTIELITVPYWALIAPLTLLSAYLLLWRPRSKSAY